MRYPLDFYEQGPLNKLFDYKSFMINFMKGLVDSALVLFVCFFACENVSVGPKSNQEYFLFVTGMVSYGASILISNIKVLTISHSLSKMHIVVGFGSYLFYAGSYLLYDLLLKVPDVHNTFLMQFTTIRFYLIVLALLAGTSLIDLAIYVISVNESELDSFNKKQLLNPKNAIDSSTRVANSLMTGVSPLQSTNNLLA